MSPSRIRGADRRSLRCAVGLATIGVLGCEPELLQQVIPVLDVEDRTVDFGPVPEGQSAIRAVTLVNPVSVVVDGFTLELAEGSSADFEVLTSSTSVAPGARLEVQVRFRPEGVGTDEGTLWVRSEYLADGEVAVTLLGGPIAPGIAVEPDPIDFGPAETATVVRTFEVINLGQANLTVTDLYADPEGNPDFAVRPWSGPTTVAPGQRVAGAIDYARSGRATAGRLVVVSDAPEMSPVEVRLLPDPYRACEDGEDNDGDGLLDFPDDPGCASALDDDESNPPECEDAATEACGSDVGACELGIRRCANRIWGPCEGDVRPVDEICDDLDNDCDTRVDEEVTGTCMINGCSGARACIESSGVEGGAWTDCIPIGGQPETCDGVDNDCNGTADDGIVEACSVNSCMGTRICVPGGTGEFTDCQVMRQSEICNGIDDDCNGPADDGIPALTCGMGVCTATAAACLNGSPGVCVPGTGGMEVCNGLDDDCNGPADDLPNLECGVGACARSVLACVNGTDNQCVPGTPGTEVCNGLDDDCNGPADDLPDITCGVGPCQRTVAACVAGTDNTCVPGTGTMEVCNGLDDDCSGVADDNGACMTPACGLTITTADPQEPNDFAGGSNPVVPAALGSRTFNYDVTLTAGDTDWMQFNFPGPGSASIATMTAQVNCVSWATATGCPSTPAVGLAAWYFDDVCSPAGQQDAFHSGLSGLAAVSSSGSVSPFGICVPQKFRLNVFSSSSICAGEALNAEVQVTVTFQ